VRAIEVFGNVAPGDALVLISGHRVTAHHGVFRLPMVLRQTVNHIGIVASASGYRKAALETTVRYSNATSTNGTAPPVVAKATSRTAHTATSEASESPQQILADAAGALGNAHGYMLQGTLTQDSQSEWLKVVADSAGSLGATVSARGARVDIVALPTGSYIRANAAFWMAHAAARAAVLANRWIQVPPSDAQALTSLLGHLAPATLSRCLTEDHGTLSIGGETTIDGQPAIQVRDAGNAPGSTPSVLAVATTGRPYPLRDTATGPTRAGGRIDACNDGKASDMRGTITFSQFGHIAPIGPPTDAIRLGQATTT